MRCPDCNRFVAYDEPQCDSASVDLNDDSVHATVTVQLNCQDCGTTLKEAEIETEEEFSHECKPDGERTEGQVPDPDYTPDDDQFEVVSEGDPQGESRVESKDRHGKPIKSARYMKTFYGFSLETEIRCRKCGEVFTVMLEGEEQASSFNECC